MLDSSLYRKAAYHIYKIINPKNVSLYEQQNRKYILSQINFRSTLLIIIIMQLAVMDLDCTPEYDEITFISEFNRNEDHIDRALRTLKEIQNQNTAIKKEMEQIKTNPKSFIKPYRDELSSKINSLRQENQSLRRMVEKTKIPSYTEMTKKKIVNQQNTQNSPYRKSMRSSYRPRNTLEEIDSNIDKNDGRSTCLNFCNSKASVEQGYITNENDEESRNALMMEIRLLLQKADAFEEELQKISKREQRQLNQNESRDSNSASQLQRVMQYKKKLIKLLQKLRNRESAMTEMVRSYRTLHQETLNQLVSATQALQELRTAKISEDVEQKYAEVLELEQRLRLINSQIEEIDHEKWLQEIAKELSRAVQRMGLEIPKAATTRELIDQLCEILIESHIVSRKDGQNKLNMLKHYHQQEKKNNSKYIMSLKMKEQTLGRKLIDIQMEKE